jgi:hypothetical protein
MDPQNPSQMPPSAPPPYTPSPAAPASAVDPKVRNLAIGLFVLGAMVLLGTFTSSWGTASERGGDAGLGLTGLEACRRGHCMTASWSDLKMGADYTIIGYLGTIAGLAAAGIAIALGVFAITNKPNMIPAKIANAVFGVAAFAFTFFLIRVLTEDKFKGISIGYSGIVAILGVVGIGVVSKMLEKERAAAAGLSAYGTRA